MAYKFKEILGGCFIGGQALIAYEDASGRFLVTRETCGQKVLARQKVSAEKLTRWKDEIQTTDNAPWAITNLIQAHFMTDREERARDEAQDAEDRRMVWGA